MSKVQNLKTYLELSEPHRHRLVKEEFEVLVKKYSIDLNSSFQILIDCKNLGLVDFAERILHQIIDRAIKEKRVWMLKKLTEHLGKRNQQEKKQISLAILDFTQSTQEKNIFHENFEIIKIVERDLRYHELFESWLETLEKNADLEVLRVIYLGILFHGVSQKGAKALSRILSFSNDKKMIKKLESDFNFEKHTTGKKQKAASVEPEIYFDLAKLEKDLHREETKINVNLIDSVVVRKYLNDILFSLLCLKDFKSIYKLNEVLENSFKRNSKEYLTYNFYKLSALLEEKKYRQVMSLVKDEILNHPLTSKEAMPFFYLLAESYLGLEKFEKALEIFLTLQEDKIFQGKAKIRINEIKKN